jgi:predicted MFS family arabinose efflux permease
MVKPVPISPIEKKTFSLDCVRFILQGFIDVEFKSCVLLIAIRVFDMSNNMKGILSAASYLGMVLAPFELRFFTKVWPLKTNHAISALLFVVSIMITFALFTDRWLIFLIAIVIAKICYKQTLPFVTDIYNQNYPKERRGWIIGKLFTILATSSIIFAYLCGKKMDQSIGNYRWILLLSTLSAFLCGCIFLKIPNGRILAYDSDSFIRSNLSFLWNDRLFTAVLGLWSLMSIAFQMTFSLRTEYLANQRYGLNLSNTDTALITSIIPAIMRIFSTLLWGKIFDTKNFATMKIMINLCFLVGISTFFFTKNFTILMLSAIALGLGYGGNLTAWQLWVTKIAPSPEKLGAYTSLDIVIMGLRDALSAALGYFLLSHSVSLHTICLIAIFLIGISTIGFCFLIKNPRLN